MFRKINHISHKKSILVFSEGQIEESRNIKVHDTSYSKIKNLLNTFELTLVGSDDFPCSSDVITHV